MNQLNYMEAAEKVTAKFTRNGGFLTVQTQNQLNTMTISWWNVGFMWQRPVLTVAVRPTRHTFGLIQKAQDFTVSIPVPDLPQALSLCGATSGRDQNKFEAAHLATSPAQQTISPIIQVPGVHFECRIVLRTAMDHHQMAQELEPFYPQKDYHTLFFGEILACYEISSE